MGKYGNIWENMGTYAKSICWGPGCKVSVLKKWWSSSAKILVTFFAEDWTHLQRHAIRSFKNGNYSSVLFKYLCSIFTNVYIEQSMMQKYIHKFNKYLYLEPKWPLFLKVNPPKNKAFSNQNKGHLGSRDIYIYCHHMSKIGVSMKKTIHSGGVLPPLYLETSLHVWKIISPIPFPTFWKPKLRLQGSNGDWKAKPISKKSKPKSRARQTSVQCPSPPGKCQGVGSYL